MRFESPKCVKMRLRLDPAVGAYSLQTPWLDYGERGEVGKGKGSERRRREGQTPPMEKFRLQPWLMDDLTQKNIN